MLQKADTLTRPNIKMRISFFVHSREKMLWKAPMVADDVSEAVADGGGRDDWGSVQTVKDADMYADLDVCPRGGPCGEGVERMLAGGSWR